MIKCNEDKIQEDRIMAQEALGMVETRGLTAAIEAADQMCKAANVALVGTEKIGSGLVTVMVRGDVGAVKAAVEQAIKKPASYAVIANPHEEIVKLVELSASRWKKKQQENPETALESKNSSKK